MLTLRKERENLGLTQAKLSKMVGISPSFLRDVETGRRNPNFKILTKIVRILNTRGNS